MKLDVEKWAQAPILDQTEQQPAKQDQPSPNTDNSKAMQTLLAKHCQVGAHHPELRDFVCACLSIAIPESECLAFLLDNTNCISSESSYSQNDLQIEELVTDIYKRYLGDFGKFHREPQPKQQEENKDDSSVRSSETLSNPNERTVESVPLMTVTTMNQALSDARKMPRMKRLMGTLLLGNTLNIWGGDNGVGKSILGFTVAEQLARGWNVLGMQNDCGPLKVLLCDYELVPQGLLKRYSDEATQQEYTFSPNVFRADFNPDFSDFGKKYDDILFAALRTLSIQVDADVLIIDNLTALKSQSNSDGDVALDLMNRLNRLKKELGLTIIVLTHVTKLPSNVPLVKNHIAGSKHIQNLCDGIVGIANSTQGDNKIYIKELKNRYEEEAYGADNVIVCQKLKKGPFLTVDLIEFDVEGNHISSVEEGGQETITDKTKAIELRNQGLSISKIATALGKSKSTIHEWTKSVRSFGTPSELDERTAESDEKDLF